MLPCIMATAQDTTKVYHHELTAVTDNDDYTWRYTDRYYSNGLFLKYTTALGDIDTKTNKGAKKILTIELGQKMYNPYRHDTAYLKGLDRPFAGELSLKATVTRINKNENVFQWGVQAGIMGPDAFGKQVQTWWHGAFNILRIYGWDTQLANEPFVNASASYHYHLIKHQPEKPWYDAHAFLAGTLGNNLTAFNAGLQFKIGAFEKASESVAWNARVQKSKTPEQHRRNHEVYFYFEPQITLQAYNAVLQGGLFKKADEKGFYYTGINHFVYQHRFGILYAQNAWTLQLGYTFKTREAIHQIAIENYGTIRVSVRFK